MLANMFFSRGEIHSTKPDLCLSNMLTIIMKIIIITIIVTIIIIISIILVPLPLQKNRI